MDFTADSSEFRDYAVGLKYSTIAAPTAVMTNPR